MTEAAAGTQARAAARLMSQKRRQVSNGGCWLTIDPQPARLTGKPNPEAL